MEHKVHGVEIPTSVGAPVVAECGIPLAVGASPIQAAENPAEANTPVLCRSWSDAVSQLGYSDDWDKYPLCEVMYAHFKLYGCQPLILVNVLTKAGPQSVESADIAVKDKQVRLPMEAINDETLVVKEKGGSGTTYKLGTDYAVRYDEKNMIVEVLPESGAYTAQQLNIAYTKVDTASVAEEDIVAGLDAADACITTVGLAPDLLLAPGWSQKPGVAAVMATKADGISGLFPAKALVDIDSGASGAKTYTAAIEKKGTDNLTDCNEIVCWPMTKLGGKKLHMSVQVAGLLAKTDAENGGCPCDSPSNRSIKADGLCCEDGTTVKMSLDEANALNNSGIVTGLKFLNGWTAWGNYTGGYPTHTDVKDKFIPVSRMMGWIISTCIRTFWGKLDSRMNRRLIDSVINTTNIWLNGLTGQEKLLGGWAEYSPEDNTTEDLMAGIIRVRVHIAAPVPAQEIVFMVEYSAEIAMAALQG